MKSLVFILSVVCLASAADFTNGQAARLVIGQLTFTAEDPGGGSNAATASLLGGVGGVALAGDTLFVVDSNRVSATPLNNRILLFRNLSAQLPTLTQEILPNTGRCPICVGEATVVVGEPDFATTDIALSQSGMRLPTAVASDGTHLVVADTDNNRVLIWNSIPLSNGQPADVVVGQGDFKSNAVNEGKGNNPTARGLRGPQGVWIQDGKLYVADTHNHRVLIWNKIPTANFQAADVVLGAPNFTTFVQPDITQITGDPTAKTMLNPVSVTSDGKRLYVTDLGYNRVLIWNTIPTSNQAPADIAVGQPDLVSGIANNSEKLCASNGTDSSGNATYPALCGTTLDFPRFALSDGQRLFIADGGNDRVLVYNSIPTASGAVADNVIGQASDTANQISDNANPLKSQATDALRTPTSLAWDGSNLYVTDPFNRRVLVFTLAEDLVPYTGIRNTASREIFAVGSVVFSGKITTGNSITITIANAASDATITHTYTYKFLDNDSVQKVIETLVGLINAGDGDPLVLATPNVTFAAITLTARQSGAGGNDITITATTAGVDSKTAADVTATATNTAGGGDAAQIAPGTLVTITGSGLSSGTVSVPADSKSFPYQLANTQVYFDGIRAPLLYVSPTQINTQIPWETVDSNSLSAWVRTVDSSGRVHVSAPRAVIVVNENPGIFADEGDDPRPAQAYHAGNGYAQGVISVDGSSKAGETATVTIEDRAYTYTVQDGDTLVAIRDALVALINANPEEKVAAYPSYYYSRIRLQSKQPGDLGNGIPYSTTTTTDSSVILTATNSAMCCAAVGRVTQDNPALPGEVIVVYATGLGLVTPDSAKNGLVTGVPYFGPVKNDPNEFVSSLAGGKTANVINAGAKPGAVGVYEVWLQLNSSLTTNPFTQLTIAQSLYVSNIVTVPVYNPNPE
jgi:uncharacterized protein (TIGR03437 family)